MEESHIEDPTLKEKLEDLNKIEIRAKRRVWQPFMEKYNCQVIAELGVQFGITFDYMIAHGPKIAVAVDSWTASGTPGQNDWAFDQKEMDRQYNDFINRMKDKPFVQTYKEFTHDAVQRFPDEYFDLIYIDADHTYHGCKQDIKDWYPKVKKGGFLTGDDFRYAYIKRSGVRFGVREAVKRYCQKHNLKYYELPRYGWAIIK